MRKTTLFVILFFVMSVFISTLVFSKDTTPVKTVKVIKKVDKTKSDPTVYIRDNGKKFHKRNCKLVSGKKGIKLSEAIKKGYEPCKICFGSKMVYVTQNGKKFHKKGCKMIKNPKAIQMGLAKFSGYEPCKTCFPKIEVKKGVKIKK